MIVMHLIEQGIAFRAEPNVSLAWRGVITCEWFWNESRRANAGETTA
jgi:hypothetical protein